MTPRHGPATARGTSLSALLALLLIFAGTSAFADDVVDIAPEELMLALINAERAHHGISALAWNDDLAKLAREHAQDLKRMGRLSHDSSEGHGVGVRAANMGLRTRRIAENIARASSVVNAHAALLASPGHRRNLLDPTMPAVGLGIVVDGRTVWIAQEFGDPLEAMSDAEAARAAMEAITSGPTPWALREDTDLSATMTKAAERLAEKDDVEAELIPAAGGCWVLAYMTLDPRAKPPGMEPTCQGERAGVGAVWRRTPRSPAGAYWVAVILAR